MNEGVGLLAFGTTFTVVLYGGYWLYLKRKVSKLESLRAARKVR